MGDSGSLSFPDAPRAELDRILAELVTVAGDVLSTQGRLRGLLRANQAIVQELELPVVLRQLIEAAVELVGAQYGALGVIAPHGDLEQFIHVGMSPHEVEAIGHLPEGHGLLGAVSDDARPIRLSHLVDDRRSSGFPAGHPVMDSFLGVPIRVRDKIFGNLYLTNQLSGEFSADDEQLVIALAATAGFAIDNARLFAETRKRQAWTTASSEITAALLSGEERDPLGLLVSRVLTLSEAHLVCVLRPSDDSTEFVVSTAFGDGDGAVQGLRFPLSGSVAAHVVDGRHPRILDEANASAAVPGSGLLFGPTMAVPLAAADRALGVLIVARRPGSAPFIATDLEIAADFAGRATVGIELSAARSARQRVLLLEDRGRIARDLHDHVIQRLFATGLELQSLAGTLPPGPTANKVTTSVDNIDVAIAQIRTAIFALASDGSDGQDTARHRIIDIVTELGRQLPHTPEIAFSGPVDLVVSGALADDVLAVMREGLTNVLKHASAEHISVYLSVIADVVEIKIADDGTGANGTEERSGLENLEARAVNRSGSFTFSSENGWTTLRWRVPIPKLEGSA